MTYENNRGQSEGEWGRRGSSSHQRGSYGRDYEGYEESPGRYQSGEEGQWSGRGMGGQYDQESGWSRRSSDQSGRYGESSSGQSGSGRQHFGYGSSSQMGSMGGGWPNQYESGRWSSGMQSGRSDYGSCSYQPQRHSMQSGSQGGYSEGYGYGGYGSGSSFGRGSGGWSSSGSSFGQQQGRGRFWGRGPKNFKVSKESIENEVNRRLYEHPELDATNIEVTVEESGVVRLSGSVDDRQAKRLAEDVAEEAFGVKEVRNEIRISSSSSNEQRFGETNGSSESGRSGSSQRGSFGSSSSSTSGSQSQRGRS